jgi:enterochelin esterase-like enzyme
MKTIRTTVTKKAQWIFDFSLLSLFLICTTNCEKRDPNSGKQSASQPSQSQPIAPLPKPDKTMKKEVAAVQLPNTEVVHLPSKHVGITYKLYVSLPATYTKGAKLYPVVFLLDADYSFAIARNMVEHMAARRQIPEIILVGIAYDYPKNEDPKFAYRVQRTRDYTPVYSEQGYPLKVQKQSGKAKQFLAFIEEELVPIPTTNRPILA